MKEDQRIPFDRTHGGGAAPGMIDFSASVNPLGPPLEAIDAYHSAASRIASYPPPHPELLEAKFAGTIGVDRDNVLAGNGSIQLIYLLARILRSRRPFVVIPTFSEIANALVIAGASPAPILLGADSNYAIDLAAIDAALAAQADAIWLGRPNSPTGTLIDDGTAAEVVERCARHNAWCIFDEAFIDFANGVASAVKLLTRFPRLIILRSLTKSFAIPGLRLGFVVAASELIANLRRAIEPWSVNVAAEAVGRACLDAPREYLEHTRRVVQHEREFMACELAAVDGIQVFPSSANFMLIDVKGETSEGAFAKHMELNHIVIRDLAALPGCNPGMYRLAVRNRADNERLVNAARSWRP